MFFTKLKIAVAVMFATTVLGVAAGGLAGKLKGAPSDAREAASGRVAAQGAAGTQTDEKAKTDKDKLQGSWLFVSVEERGTKVPEEEVRDRKSEMVFSGDKVTFPIKAESKEAEYKLDPSKKPKEIDLVLEDKTLKGIYLLEGDTLKLCVQKEADGERPTKFTTDGSSNILIGLKRKK